MHTVSAQEVLKWAHLCFHSSSGQDNSSMWHHPLCNHKTPGEATGRFHPHFQGLQSRLSDQDTVDSWLMWKWHIAAQPPNFWPDLVHLLPTYLPLWKSSQIRWLMKLSKAASRVMQNWLKTMDWEALYEPSITMTEDKVRKELHRLHLVKALGHTAHSLQCGVLLRIFNMSLNVKKIRGLWDCSWTPSAHLLAQH